MKNLILLVCFLIPASTFSQSIIGERRYSEKVTTQSGEVSSWEYIFYIQEPNTLSTELAICKKNGVEYLRNGNQFYLKKEKGKYIKYVWSTYSMRPGEKMDIQTYNNLTYQFGFEFVDNNHVYLVISGDGRKLFTRQ
jgi:hypothetical protein